ncbi:hypothetical protein M2317_001599 [Microbacterium sp. ZKA21]|uniref:DUF6716 putative glycosyltransferase n=1 Tax=Microbacterium sp. ZKA21 TaxID=3381694 RepID=UPI003D2410E7
MSARLRVVAIADADSFVKWSASLLAGVDGIRRHLLIVTTPLTVSRAQERAALAGTGFTDAEVTRLSFDEVRGWLAGHQPDAVVLAGRGAFVRLLGGQIDRLDKRPVVVGGLPGMSIPTQRGALEYRKHCDLVVLHSHRERRAFAELGKRIGVDVPLGLATLPYARSSFVERAETGPRAPEAPADAERRLEWGAGIETGSQSQTRFNSVGSAVLAGRAGGNVGLGRRLGGAGGLSGTAVLAGRAAEASSSTGQTKGLVETQATLRPPATDLVFAAQAMVPVERHERQAVADILVRAAEANPRRRVVVKLRSRPGEAETHLEQDAYVDLFRSRPSNLVFSYQPMSAALERAEGLVTVSSTAAIEALAAGVPVIALDTFGVRKPLLNTVFIGSGLLGGGEEVVRRQFRHPHPGWMWDNYFHPASESGWWRDVEQLIARRRAGELAPRQMPSPRGGALHAAWHRKSVLGSADRSVSGAVALAVGAPLVRGILSRRRASADTWSETGTDFTLEPAPHADSLRR